MSSGEGIALAVLPEDRRYAPMSLRHDTRFLALEKVADGVVLRFVRPSVSLDDPNAQRMGELLTHFIDGGEAGHLIVELGNVEYVSSTALGVFVRLHWQMIARGGRLTLRNMRDTVYAVSEVMQLTGILDIRRRGPSERDGGHPSATPTSRPPAS
jgi:anti-sigma B factor antagonist